MTELVFDYDPFLYSCGSVAEKRSVLATHRATGEEYEVGTRTDFYGHWKKKEGGLLAKLNEGALKPMLADDFDYEDIQEPLPFSWATNAVDTIIANARKEFEEDGKPPKYWGYVGKGEVFRHSLATLHPYKDGRDKALKPIYLDKLKEYLVQKHNAQIITHYEVDDKVNMDTFLAFKEWKAGTREMLVTVACDKDALSGPCHLYNPTTKHFSTIDGFGKLWIQHSVTAAGNKTSKLTGEGRVWLYAQLFGDDADTYWATSACDKPTKWGEMSTYKLLCDAKTDKEAMQLVVDQYKVFYPEERDFTNFRGDTFKIDWLYCLNEIWQLARMRRWEGDEFHVQTVLDKLGVIYK